MLRGDWESHFFLIYSEVRKGGQGMDLYEMLHDDITLVCGKRICNGHNNNNKSAQSNLGTGRQAFLLYAILF